MRTRTKDLELESPCFFTVKKTWYVSQVPIPCPEDENVDAGPSLAFARLPTFKEVASEEQVDAQKINYQ